MYLHTIFFTVTAIVVNLLNASLCNPEFNRDTLHRTRRQLLFPNSTVLQFNVGIGTPTPITTVNVNWAFQANFQLPWNRSQIPIDLLEANTAYITDARKKREVNEIKLENPDGGYENDARIYHFYKYVEDVLNGFGYNGTSCVLRTLCQLGADPLHTNMEDDLLHELATFVLTPENDLVDADNSSPESTPYIVAQTAGRNNQDCFSLYDRCSIQLLEIFSKYRDLSLISS